MFIKSPTNRPIKFPHLNITTRKTLFSACTIFGLLFAGHAAAFFTEGENFTQRNTTWGKCSVEINGGIDTFVPGTSLSGLAHIRISQNGRRASRLVAGTDLSVRGNVVGGQLTAVDASLFGLGQPDAAFLQTACGFSDVTSLTQSVAFGPGSTQSFETATAIFLTFIATLNGETNRYEARIQAPTPDGNPTATLSVGSATVTQSATAPSAETAALLTSRARHTLISQPDLSLLLSGAPGQYFNAQVTRFGADLDLGFGTTNSWVNVSASEITSDTTESRAAIATAGLHYRFNHDLLAGVMLQVDHISSEISGSTQKGTGWMIGPYAIFRPAGGPLTFDMRYLAGQGEGEISGSNGTGTFKSNRNLARIGMTGTVQSGNALWSPFLRAARYEETTDAWTSDTAVTTPSMNIVATDVSLGLGLQHPLSRTVTFDGALSAFHRSEKTRQSQTLYSDLSIDGARLELGVNGVTASNAYWSVSTFFETTEDSYRAQGIEAAYHITF